MLAGETRRSWPDGPRLVAAACVCVLWLATLAVGASPQLHHLFHQDSDNQEHDCIIAHLSKGQVLAAAMLDLPVVANPVGLDSSPLPHPLPIAFADYRVAPSRAPPLALLLHGAVGESC
jgi:hypothetical protein